MILFLERSFNMDCKAGYCGYLFQSGGGGVHLCDGLLDVVDLVVDALLVARDLALAVDAGRLGHGVGDAARRAGRPVRRAVPARTLPRRRAARLAVPVELAHAVLRHPLVEPAVTISR